MACFARASSPACGSIPQALYADDLDRLVEVLEQGLATPEHAAFAARLAEAHGASAGRVDLLAP